MTDLFSASGMTPPAGTELPGAAERDEAIARVDDHADPAWKENAYLAVKITAFLLDEFTTDDVWEMLKEAIGGQEGGFVTHEARALGPIMQRAARDGIIVATDRVRPSNRPVCHRNPKRVWKAVRRG